MTLVAVLADGAEVAGKAAIALGPIAGPQLAAAEPAEEPVAVMLTEEGAAVVQAPEAEPVAVAEPEPVAEVEAAPEPQPATVAAVSIDTISYTASGAVQLGGRGQPGGFVRFYLDNAALQTVLVPDGGQWFTTLKEVPPGVYVLRADQLDAAGKVTSRFETPFKRETLEALAAVAESPRLTGAAPGKPLRQKRWRRPRGQWRWPMRARWRPGPRRRRRLPKARPMRLRRVCPPPIPRRNRPPRLKSRRFPVPNPRRSRLRRSRRLPPSR